MKGLSIYTRYLLILLLALSVSVFGNSSASASNADNSRSELVGRKAAAERLQRGKAHPDRIIVKFKTNTSREAQENIRRQEKLEKVHGLGLIRSEVVRVQGRSPEAAVRALNKRTDIEYAEPDYKRLASGYTDEERFGELWGLQNSGQTVGGTTGTADVDINASEASTVTLGHPEVVVAVIDDGVDFTHPDLEGRQWLNPGESGVDASGNDKATNRLDDDGNGYVDDVNGWDFCHGDDTVHDPIEADAHGTHVAGIIGGNLNGSGVVGVAPNVKIMALKFLGTNCGYDSEAIRAIEYVRNKGARIINASWGGTGDSRSLEWAIEDSEALFVAAAGNGGMDGIGDNNDTAPSYPASYDSPNILSVAAIDNRGSLASFSNYGAKTVDIAAPGVGILSTVPALEERSSLVLSSYNGGKAVVSGFGVEEINDATARAQFLTKALAAVSRVNEPVILVDDDSSHVGAPDVGPTVSAAIQSATGTAPTVLRVGDGNGPGLTALQGKVVVWATGLSYSSGPNSSGYLTPTLTSTDQTTLTNFLAGGGKLVLTGMDALLRIESSPFVKDVLKIRAVSDVGFTGASKVDGVTGTVFDRASYQLTNPSFAVPYFHDALLPSPAGTTQTLGVYPAAAAGYESWDGTSMAAPYATGTAALVASVKPSLRDLPVALRSLLLSGAKPAASTAGKTATGKMIDAEGSIAISSETAAPVAGSISRVGGPAEYTNMTSIGLAVSASDPEPSSGLSYMRFSNDGSTWSAWRPYATNTWWNLTTGDGIKTVRVQFLDGAGNISETANFQILLDTTSPDVNAPEHAFETNSTLDADAVPVKVSWSGSDAGSGIGQYALRESVNGEATYPALPTPLTTSLIRSVIPGRTYQFCASAVDRVWNVRYPVCARTVGVVVYEESSPEITFDDVWTTSASSTAYGGRLKSTEVAGGTATLTFTGDAITWVAPLGPDSGEAEVYVDGAKVATVDLYSSTERPRQIVFAQSVSPSTPHTLQVRALGTRNSVSAGARVDLDAFVTLVSPAPVDTYIYGGSLGAVSSNQASFYFGSYSEGATFECSLDGGDYTGCASPQPYSNLAEGAHTLLVRATDSAGRVDPTPASRTWTVDTGTPTTTKFSINGGAIFTNQRTVTLSVASTDPLPSSGLHDMSLLNYGWYWTDWQPYAETKSWALTTGDGTKTVYVRVRDRAQNVAADVSDTIVLDTTKPAVTAPTHSLAANTTLGTSTIPVRLSWSGTDATSGVVKYQLQQRAYTNGVWGAWGWVSQGTSIRALIRQVAPGRYQFQVRAQDRAGNWSAWKAGTAFVLSSYDETSPSISYTGTWARVALSGAYGGNVKHASASTARAKLTFTGRQVQWVSTRSADRGKAEVWVDGAKVATVDLYSSSVKLRQTVFTKVWSTSGTHTLEVRVLGMKNVASTGTRVDVDAFLALR